MLYNIFLLIFNILLFIKKMYHVAWLNNLMNLSVVITTVSKFKHYDSDQAYI